jgi:hypothetical protein
MAVVKAVFWVGGRSVLGGGVSRVDGLVGGGVAGEGRER